MLRILIFIRMFLHELTVETRPIKVYTVTAVINGRLIPLAEQINSKTFREQLFVKKHSGRIRI